MSLLLPGTLGLGNGLRLFVLILFLLPATPLLPDEGLGFGIAPRLVILLPATPSLRLLLVTPGLGIAPRRVVVRPVSPSSLCWPGFLTLLLVGGLLKPVLAVLPSFIGLGTDPMVLLGLLAWLSLESCSLLSLLFGRMLTLLERFSKTFTFFEEGSGEDEFGADGPPVCFGRNGTCFERSWTLIVLVDADFPLDSEPLCWPLVNKVLSSFVASPASPSSIPRFFPRFIFLVFSRRL
mmetsp:Transcript_59742/g.138104  ORF Transcript_59742/g.138104 Transcript_59742/m.138104 type:complete len:236 (-) Transcript_59742:59-766(-)